MFKTFTLENVVDEQLSETEGKRTFHLIDENGDKRRVWGNTLLDDNAVPMDISANKKREIPLIECLSKSELGETISIEFKQYNMIFGREDEAVSARTIAELAKEMQSKPMRLGSLIKTIELS